MAISVCLYSYLEKSGPEVENGLLTAFACQWIKNIWLRFGQPFYLIGTF